MNTGAVSTDCLKHLAWVQLISWSKGLALISQKDWIGSEGSASHPQLLQQRDRQHTGALLDTGRVVLKGALWTVTPLLTALREAGHLSGDMSTREGAPLAGLAFPVESARWAACLSADMDMASSALLSQARAGRSSTLPGP